MEKSSRLGKICKRLKEKFRFWKINRAIRSFNKTLDSTDWKSIASIVANQRTMVMIKSSITDEQIARLNWRTCPDDMLKDGQVVVIKKPNFGVPNDLLWP